MKQVTMKNKDNWKEVQKVLIALKNISEPASSVVRSVPLLAYLKERDGAQILCDKITPTWPNLDACINVCEFMMKSRRIQRCILKKIIQNAKIAYIDHIESHTKHGGFIYNGMCPYLSKECMINGLLCIAAFEAVVPVFKRSIIGIVGKDFSHDNCFWPCWWPIDDSTSRIKAFDLLMDYVINEYK